ncbi:MAG: ArtI protein, partial [Rhodoferax sp.]|nr:ArtI protein [Rhodoferax sp.]
MRFAPLAGLGLLASILAGCMTPPSSGSSTAVAAAAAMSHLDTVQSAATLRICTPGDYKPFSFQKADGAYEGIDVDLMNGFAASLGAKPMWVKTTWANLLPDLT